MPFGAALEDGPLETELPSRCLVLLGRQNLRVGPTVFAERQGSLLFGFMAVRPHPDLALMRMGSRRIE